MYQQLAHIYDWPGALDFAEKILALDLEILRREQVPAGARILDLACGTGTLAIALVNEGYTVVGVDRSEAMLLRAQFKAEEANLAKSELLHWQQGDMRFFTVDEPVDVVLCHYDSLNHLSNDSELRATFFQVIQALKPDGLFLFDLNTLENYQTFWNGTDTYEGPNYRLRTRSSFSEQTGKAEVHFDVDEHTEEGLVQYSEVVHEQFFDEAVVEKYLMASEFYDIRHHAFNPVDEIPADFPLKTFWFSRRRV